MNLFIDFSNEKDHPSIHDRYLSGRYSQTYPSRKQDTPEFFFPGTGIRTEERDSVYIQICILRKLPVKCVLQNKRVSPDSVRFVQIRLRIGTNSIKLYQFGTDLL